MRKLLRRAARSLLLAPVAAAPLASQSTDALAGLWGFEANLGTSASGELVLSHEGSAWHLRLAGFEVAAQQRGDSVHLSLPGERGALHVAVSADSAAPRAMWVQSTQRGAYALPVRLSPGGPATWRGRVAPLNEQFALYLAITPDREGALLARFRNPQANFGGGRVFRVSREDSTVVLTDTLTGRRRFVQPYDPEAPSITFSFGTSIAALRRTPENSPGFVARTPSAGPYRYRVAAALGDGWESSSASAEGMNEDSLAALIRHVIATDPSDDAGERVHGIVVARHGRVVLDEYFYGYDADQLHDLRSASKTMTSIMLGVAMHRGLAISTETKVTPAGATVGQLLTHTSGLACDDNDGDSPGNEDVMQSQDTLRDWYRYALQLPQVHPPGTAYAYCSAGINLVGGAIAAADGRWLPRFFDEELARPLRITHYAMNLMPTGEGYVGGGLHLRPRDLLKFGQLYLDGGTWRGTRLVDQAWVERSTRRQQPIVSGADDGFAWHLQVLRVGDRAFPTYQAGGNGGQILVVVPSLDLVVALTAGHYGEGRWLALRESLIARYILSSVER